MKTSTAPSPDATRASVRPQLAFVNHLFAVVGRDTAEAVDRSSLLRECADFTTTRVSAAGGESWTGRYLTMRTTYVELFGPGDAGGADADDTGSIGLALGGDVPGVIDRLVAEAEAHGVALERGVRRRAFGADEIDWFHMAGVPDRTAGTPLTLDLWAMEYVSSYFAHPASGKRPSAGPADDVSRLRYNAGSYRGSLIEELAAAEFAVDRNQYDARVRPMLAACGFRLSDLPCGAEARSDEASLTFRFATAPGLRALHFRLREPIDHARTEEIGHSRLTVGPGRDAHWLFEPA